MHAPHAYASSGRATPRVHPAPLPALHAIAARTLLRVERQRDRTRAAAAIAASAARMLLRVERKSDRTRFAAAIADIAARTARVERQSDRTRAPCAAASAARTPLPLLHARSHASSGRATALVSPLPWPLPSLAATRPRAGPTRRGDSLATTAVAGNWSAALKHARCIGCELLRTAANNNFNTLLSGSSTRPHAEHRHTNTHQTETSHTTHLTHSRSETFSLVATHVGEATPNPLQE